MAAHNAAHSEPCHGCLGAPRMAHLRGTVSLLLYCRYYSDLAGPENAKKYQTLIFLAGSASAEFIADVALCPFEAVKVRVE